MKDIVIIGNGIAGVTAARYIRKHSNHRIKIISDETPYFFSRTALMYVYMGHMKFEHTQPYESYFWKKNHIDLIQNRVNKINIEEKTLELQSEGLVSYDILILATGSKPNKFGWPGEDLDGVMGMYHKQDLENLEKHAPNNKVCKRGVIVGGGLIGIEFVEMLASRNIPVTFLVRETSFWNGILPNGESEMISQHIKDHHIDLRVCTNLKEIKSNENGKVKSIIIKETGEEIPCDLVGLTAGVSPNIDFIKNSGIETGRGVKVNQFLETNIADVYAIGDCAEQRKAIENRPTIESVWYTGRMMGETLAQTICGNKKKYNPGHWFNSAKFMDIEYQTYGWVHGGKEKPDYEEQFHWRHSSAKKCITVAYHRDSNLFLGINTFGIRMRHEVFDQWLTEKRSINYVMKHLTQANFDPELFTKYENEISMQFQQTKLSTIS